MNTNPQYEASLAAREAMFRAGGPAYVRLCASTTRPVCLSQRFGNRGDMPETTRITLMSESVARALAIFGLQAPVSLTHVVGLWWVARVDAAQVYDSMELGAAYCTRVVSTEDLIYCYSDGYAEVTRGPFATAEEALGSLPIG